MFYRNYQDVIRHIAHHSLSFSRDLKKPTLPKLSHLLSKMAPMLIALTFAGVAHAQGTMDFSSATTLMGTFKTFAIYAGAVICFGGLIFAGIRMISGRFQDAIPGLFGALFGAGVLGWGAGWIGFDHGYVITSHSSQGLTAGRVIVNVDTAVHQELITSRFAYVSVSRAAHDAHIYTNDASALAVNLARTTTKTAALGQFHVGGQDNGISI
jgi:hypothetical protein